MAYSERDAYGAIVAAIESTGAFQAIRLGDPERLVDGDRPGPLAIVSPGSWSESSTDDPSVSVHRATYRVAIVVRGRDAACRFDESSRLATLAVEPLVGNDLGGGCIPSLTTIDRVEYQLASGDAETTCLLRGTFSFLTNSGTPTFPWNETSPQQ